MFNATSSNISAISWRPVLVVEEAGVPGEDHRQATGKLYHLRLQVECTLFCNLQSRSRTHVVLVIGLYELLGNPTTYLIEPPGPLLNQYNNSVKVIVFLTEILLKVALNFITIYNTPLNHHSNVLFSVISPISD